MVAVVVLLAVLPTMELAEQAIHAIGHVLEAQVPDHSAHHADHANHASQDGAPGDEHGCTGLLHLCACHHTQVTAASPAAAPAAVETLGTVTAELPPPLVDLHALEPPQRPPIG